MAEVGHAARTRKGVRGNIWSIFLAITLAYGEHANADQNVGEEG